MSQTKRKDILENMATPGPSAIEKIKTELRNWYGNLSVKELVYNKVLVAEIEKLERLLAGKVVVG
ncbi:MAG: hypothetical protein ACK5V3_15785 [Bdellovibrionales bacterium]